MNPTVRKDQLDQYLKPGVLFDEKYRIIGVLGQGSFATVVHARHEAMDRDVALKFLRPELVDSDPGASERFRKEVRIVSRLTSPHTVMVFDVGETPEGIHYMVLEHVPGHTVDVELELGGAMGVRRAVELCIQILKSLEEAHGLGVIHRDLKPANLMIGRVSGKDDQIKVLDFGVAKLLEGPQRPSGAGSAERHSTQFVGTPTYMSPEQIVGEPVSPASDLYSVGLILYELLTGQTAIEEESVAKVARIHLDDDPIPMSRLDEIPPVLARIILKATSRFARDRFESAEELHGILLRGLSSKKKDGEVRKSRSVQPEIAEADMSDVFLGRSYVAAPEKTPIPTRKPSPLPGMSRAQPLREREEKKLEPSRPLELDVEQVSRTRVARSDITLDDMRRRNEESHTRKESGLATISMIGLILGAYGLFIAASAPLGEESSSMRIIVGMLPLGAAATWTVFSTVPTHYQSWVRRWLLPMTRNTWTILAGLCVVYLFFGHRMAAEAFTEESAWFYGFLPESGVFTFFESLTQRIGEALGEMYAMIGGVLPW
ncbi:MAG: serine/threonine protein kinase [Bradymonadaceae bacterium]